MTDDELDSIRDAWRCVQPDHSVQRLLAYIEELKARAAERGTSDGPR
jgi:hypothetical protein